MSFQRHPFLFLFLATLFQTEFSTCVTEFSLDNESGTNVPRDTIEVNPILTLYTRGLPTDSPKVAELKKELSDLQRQQNRATRRLTRLGNAYWDYLTTVNGEIRQLNADIKQSMNDPGRAAELKNQLKDKIEKRRVDTKKYKTRKAPITEEMDARATLIQQKYNQIKEEEAAVKSLKKYINGKV